MTVQTTGSKGRRAADRPEPLEDAEVADRATVEGGTARSGAVGSKADGRDDDEPATVGSTIRTKRADGSTRSEREDSGEGPRDSGPPG